MAKVSYEDWIQAVKDRCKELREDYEYLAEWYSFNTAFNDGMKPNAAVKDCIEWLNAA